MPKSNRSIDKQHKRKVAVISAAYAAVAVMMYCYPWLYKAPQHNSALTGHAWLNELLAGHPQWFHNMMGMSKHIFRELSHELGVLAGLHAFVPEDLSSPYRDCKACLSQNILVACTFDMHFSYVLAGWEGSASDSRVFDDVRAHGFFIPPGKFYLANAGFAICDALLVPYHGVRYHLKEWGRASQR
jgi:hypothetical protein